MWIELLIINVIICFIVDISGVIDSIKYGIWKWVFNGKRDYQEFRLKPVDCSTCMTFWIGLLWITIYGQFNLINLLFVCLFATISEEMTNTILIIKHIIHRVQDDIELLITNNR